MSSIGQKRRRRLRLALFGSDGLIIFSTCAHLPSSTHFNPHRLPLHALPWSIAGRWRPPLSSLIAVFASCCATSLSFTSSLSTSYPRQPTSRTCQPPNALPLSSLSYRPNVIAPPPSTRAASSKHEPILRSSLPLCYLGLWTIRRSSSPYPLASCYICPCVIISFHGLLTTSRDLPALYPPVHSSTVV